MKKINWLNHFFEFIVVLLGILLAFQLNTCAANKKQSKIINTHEEQLFEETQFNKSNVESAIKFGESNLKDLDTLLSIIYAEGNIYRVNGLSLKLLNVGGLYLRKNAYKSLLETGDIRFMKDFETKNKVVNLYEYYAWVEAMDKVMLDSYNKIYYPYLYENFDLAKGSIQDKKIYFNKKFINAVSTYRFTLSMKLKKYKECLVEIEKFLEKNQTKKE